MNNNTEENSFLVTRYKISYFIFSIFIACVIVYIYKKGFKPEDSILIPVLSILIYVLIVYLSNSISNNNKTKYIKENFANHIEISPSVNDLIENLQNKKDISLDQNNVESESNVEGEVNYNDPTTTLEPTITPEPPTMPPETTNLPQTTLEPPPMPEEMSSEPETTLEPPTMPQETAGEPSTTLEPPTMQPTTTMMAPTTTKFNDEKQNEILDMNKNKKIDTNKYSLRSELPVNNKMNKNIDSQSPININISYSNKRVPRGKNSVKNINDFRFDSGLDQRRGNDNVVNNFANTLANSLANNLMNNNSNNFLLPSKKKTHCFWRSEPC